jgi:N-acetylglucosaminyldiphosphoundecaprenol N-acetyl-beta-D-mannosaminyltransferase
MKESILGIPADIVTLHEAVERVWQMVDHNRPHFVASVNPEICMASRKDSALKAALLSADLGIPDGVGIVLASRLRRGAIRTRVTGIDLMQLLVARAAGEGKKIFLFGAAEGVAADAATNLQQRYPSLQIAGTAHGYIPPEKEEDVARAIKASGADIVFVGLGSPRQELFAVRHGQASGAKVLMVVGGSFDVLSGRLSRAPQIYQKFGIEWLFRAIQQPKRLKRMLALPRFLWTALQSKE